MAKMKVFDIEDASTILNTGYYFDNFFNIQDGATTKRAIYVDNGDGSDGNKMVVSGKGLHYSGDTITEGTISSIALMNDHNKSYITIDSLNVSAANFMEAYNDGAGYLLEFLLNGPDTITGSNLSDTLNGYIGKNTIHGGGGRDSVTGGDNKDKLFGDAGNDDITGRMGNDTMTGGKGSDVFYFYGVSGEDVITDFDAKGGGKKQDYLDFGDHGGFEVRKAGHDVLIEFYNFDTIRLEDVAFKDFSVDDDVHKL